MWRALLPVAAGLALIGSVHAETLRGTARGHQSHVEIVIWLQDGVPSLVDLAYSPQESRPAYFNLDEHPATYDGVTGSVSRTPINLRETRTLRLQFYRWQLTADGSYTAALRTTGTVRSQDSGSRVFFYPTRPGTGSAELPRQPARSGTSKFRERVRVAIQGLEKPRHTTSPASHWQFRTRASSSGIDAIEVEFFETSPGIWKVWVDTWRIVPFGDTPRHTRQTLFGRLKSRTTAP